MLTNNYVAQCFTDLKSICEQYKYFLNFLIFCNHN